MRRATWALLVAGGILVALTTLWLSGIVELPSDDPAARLPANLATPPQFQAGEALFVTHCAECHGIAAMGTDQGPSLLWKIYAPHHHSDASFYLAVQQGVRAHHWRYGHMPPIPGVGQEEVTQVIAYVRWLQEQSESTPETD